jgi:O-methyltransferase
VTDLKRALATLLLPTYSERLDQANWYARLREWQSKNLAGVPVLPDRPAFYQFINRAILGEVPINFLEFGVYQGASLTDWTRLNVHPHSRFWGFDSFAGLPDHWIPGFERGSFSNMGRPPELSDPRVKLIPGLFQHSLPSFIDEFTATARLVVNHDSDLYSSTLYCLSLLDSILETDSVIIFDEFPNPIHEFRAFVDYCASFRRKLKPIALGGRDLVQCAFTVE